MLSLRIALSILAVAAAIAPLATAQVVPGAIVTGFQAQVGPAVHAIAGGMDVTAGATVGVGAGGGSASLHFVPDPGTAAVTLAYDLGCVAVSSTTARAVGELRHELWSARPLVGHLVVSWSAIASGTGSATVGIDLGDDGSVEANGAAVIPCALAAGLTAIRVRLAASANAGTLTGPWGVGISYQGAATAHLAIRFEPLHCTTSPLGGGCPGPQLTAVGNLAAGVDLRATVGAGDDLVVVLLSFDPAMAAVPFVPGCILLAAPIATLWAAPDAVRAASWSLVWPAGIGVVGFAAQAVACDAAPFAASASAALAIGCQ